MALIGGALLLQRLRSYWSRRADSILAKAVLAAVAAFEMVGPTEHVAALRSLVTQLRNECAASGVSARAFGPF